MKFIMSLGRTKRAPERYNNVKLKLFGEFKIDDGTARENYINPFHPHEPTPYQVFLQVRVIK
jgi:hypothetical protein